MDLSFHYCFLPEVPGARHSAVPHLHPWKFFHSRKYMSSTNTSWECSYFTDKNLVPNSPVFCWSDLLKKIKWIIEKSSGPDLIIYCAWLNSVAGKGGKERSFLPDLNKHSKIVCSFCMFVLVPEKTNRY